jgi:hypothetical protein
LKAKPVFIVGTSMMTVMMLIMIVMDKEQPAMPTIDEKTSGGLQASPDLPPPSQPSSQRAQHR